MGATASHDYPIMSDGNIHPLRFDHSIISCMEKNNIAKFKTIFNGTKDNPQEARDCRGASLLHLAAEYGNADITKYLISLGFNVNLQDEYGRTPLHFALKKLHFATAKILLQSNADIWACDTFGISALQVAITTDPLNLPFYKYCDEWLNEYWQIVGTILNKVDEDYLHDSEKVADILLKAKCPLTHLVFMKNLEVMRIMIEKGSFMNVKDRFTGKTALHLAVHYWKLDKVTLLLDYKADVNILDFCKRTPIMCIYSQTRYRQIMPLCEVKLLKVLSKQITTMIMLDPPTCINQLYDIFRFGSKNAIKMMLEYDNDILLVNDKEVSLLYPLVLNSNPGIREIIKGIKKHVNSKSYDENTVLGEAVDYGIYDMVEFLLSEGASLDIANGWDGTPMHQAFRLESESSQTGIQNRIKCIKIMLEYGADPEIRYENGDTILQEIVQRKRPVALAEPVLAQFAIREAMGISISEEIREQIKSYEEFQTYFNSRIKELEEAKTSIIFRSVTVFEFLTTTDEIILLYARNRGLATQLEGLIDRLKLDSYYVDILRRRTAKVLKIAKSRERADTVICQTIGKLYECNSVITRMIVDYLNDDDVQKLL